MDTAEPRAAAMWKHLESGQTEQRERQWQVNRRTEAEFLSGRSKTEEKQGQGYQKHVSNEVALTSALQNKASGDVIRSKAALWA